MLEIFNKDFTGQNLSERTDLNDAVFYHCCFSQEKPDSAIFPVGMTGACFAYCNMDNVFIPAGNAVAPNCSTRRFVVQPDGHDWLIDENDNPVEMVNPPKDEA